LQIKSPLSTENRVIYGRLLPYSHSNNRWSASNDDEFEAFGQEQAQVVRLNLYIRSVHCAALLRGLSTGRTVSEISQDMDLGLSGGLKARFGATALAAGDLVFRPVAYLLNRDAYDRRSPASPHGGAGALSASISQTDKSALFRLSQDYNGPLTALMVKRLNADTGMDFGDADVTRFGDLELLVFPTLDDHDRNLLTVEWTNAPRALIVRFNAMQMQHFSGFQFRLSIANDGQIVYAGIATAERDAPNVFECKFALSDHLRAITDTTELEIFGFHEDRSCESTLCCRWRIGYVREVHLQGHVIGNRTNPVMFDWLKNGTPQSASMRVTAALAINRGNQNFISRIGGRTEDPWVPGNRDLVSLFARIQPPKSDGRFFLRRDQKDNEGRLQFVEWFKALLAKYQHHQVGIFDPFFEDAGLGLVLVCAASNADYVVFRSLPKNKKLSNENAPRESDTRPREGIDNLLANCEKNRHLLQCIKLRIYGLKEGQLHDRYILVMGQDSSPVAGFNLSNSFQGAAKDNPLLVTPIPADVLLQVTQYMSGLMKEAEAAKSEVEIDNPSLRLLFDSTASSMTPRRYEPLRFLEKAQAGNVLSVWTDEPSLQGLNGDPLKEQLTALDMFSVDADRKLSHL